VPSEVGCVRTDSATGLAKSVTTVTIFGGSVTTRKPLGRLPISRSGDGGDGGDALARTWKTWVHENTPRDGGGFLTRARDVTTVTTVTIIDISYIDQLVRGGDGRPENGDGGDAFRETGCRAAAMHRVRAALSGVSAIKNPGKPPFFLFGGVHG